MKRNQEFPKASIIKVAKGNFKVLTKKSFMAKSEEVEKHFKSQTKAIEWAMSHGYNAEW